MKKRYVTLISLVTSIALILFGLMQGQNHTVWVKAAKICLECIGIG